MQTFLPYKSFKKSVRVLDDRRLGKQRVEAMQIINCHTSSTSAWKNHPATKMWEGYTDALKAYANEAIKEWIKRGFNNNMQFYDIPDCYELPPWLGDKRIHIIHRRNLIRKDSSRYSKYWPKLKPCEGYKWPYNRKNGSWVRNF